MKRPEVETEKQEERPHNCSSTFDDEKRVEGVLKSWKNLKICKVLAWLLVHIKHHLRNLRVDKANDFAIFIAL